MSEEKFWTEFFRSRHFHRDRYTTSKTSKDLFGECAEKDEQQQLRENLEKFEDPLLDLTDNELISEEVYQNIKFFCKHAQVSHTIKFEPAWSAVRLITMKSQDSLSKTRLFYQTEAAQLRSVRQSFNRDNYGHIISLVGSQINFYSNAILSLLSLAVCYYF